MIIYVIEIVEIIIIYIKWNEDVEKWIENEWIWNIKKYDNYD